MIFRGNPVITFAHSLSRSPITVFSTIHHLFQKIPDRIPEKGDEVPMETEKKESTTSISTTEQTVLSVECSESQKHIPKSGKSYLFYPFHRYE